MHTFRKSLLFLILAAGFQSLLIPVDLPAASPGGAGNTHESADGRPEEIVPVYSGPQAGGYFLIRFFQVAISPQDGPNCRHTPVCSVYGARAVKKHGVLLGSCLAGERLLRCNPYRKSEIDPVPEDIGNLDGNGAGDR